MHCLHQYIHVWMENPLPVQVATCVTTTTCVQSTKVKTAKGITCKGQFHHKCRGKVRCSRTSITADRSRRKQLHYNHHYHHQPDQDKHIKYSVQLCVCAQSTLMYNAYVHVCICKFSRILFMEYMHVRITLKIFMWQVYSLSVI